MADKIWIQGYGTVSVAGWANPTVDGGYLNAASSLFNGTTSKVDFGANFRPAKTDPWTVSFWLKVDNVLASAFVHLIGNYNTDTSKGWVVFLRRDSLLGSNQPTINLSWGGTGSLVIEAHEFILSSNTWYHVCVLSNGGTQATSKIVINGVDRATTAYTDGLTAAAYDSNVTIGIAPNGVNPLAGKWDEQVFAASTALSVADCATLYNSGRPSTPTGVTGVTNWHRMGTDFVDQIGAINGSGTDVTASSDMP